MHWILDAVIVLMLVTYAVRGWRSGLVAGAFSLAGTVLGILAGLWAGPRIVAAWGTGWPVLAQSLALIGAAVVGAGIGEGLIGSVGRRIRGHRHPHAVDATLGAAGAVLVSALVIGVLVAAIKPIAPPTWARTIDESVALSVIRRALPAEAARQASQLTEVLHAAGLPRAFSGLFPEPELPVPAPDDATAQSAGVQAAAGSIALISAAVPECRGPLAGNSGSGWVSAPERVVTNAHVVAGSDAVAVQVGGQALPATVVAFSPDLDLAVLHVPGLTAPALVRSEPLAPEAPVAVAGFPGGGPYTVTSGRVRGTVEARGDDIYGAAVVDREIYALRAHAEPGNSGGPVLNEAGQVAGTVFAISLVDAETTYALTNAQTEAVIDGAAAATAEVSTQGCTP